MSADDGQRKPAASTWRVIAVELDQSMPLRTPEQPHRYVGLTKVGIEERFGDLLTGAGPKD